MNKKPKNIYTPVDIIIPFHGNYHILSECIESIITKTFGAMYTITIVDDCSPNKNFISDLEEKKLKHIPIQYIRHREQKGFGASLKSGFDKTQNNWVLFLHSDCRIEQTGWLTNMLVAMDENKKDGIKFVSAKVNNGGTGCFDSVILGDINKTKNVIATNSLPIICSLVNRKLFNFIGGFIKPYKIGWYEDEELFWRMKLSGFKQMVCGESYVHHHGGLNMQEFLKDEKLKQIIENNKNIYISDIRNFSKHERNNSSLP